MREHILVLPFIDGSENFALGFEAGKLWAEVRGHLAPPKVSVYFHRKNREQILLIAKARSYQVSILEHEGGEWDYVTMVRGVN